MMRKMTRLAQVSLVALCILTSTILVSAEDRPNFVLVMADDQGWGDMAYNGHQQLKTPNFDQAAAEGLRFDKFYAAAPVCSPTRASVMTGRTPNRMGVFKWGYPLRPQETTIAEALSKAGYKTGHFGKWHLGSVRRDSLVHPGKHGFDRWVSAPNFFENNPVLSNEGTATRYPGESSHVTVDLALQWIGSQAKSDTPFLAVVWFGSPHSPHQASDEDLALYPDQKRNLKHFYGEISGMDRAFGKLITGLEEHNVRENTVLWYCSDNGALPNIGSAGNLRGNKGDVYEGGLMVPAIIQWPAIIKTPRIVNDRCTTCDIFPTLLDLAGATDSVASLGSRPLDGVSLRPLIEKGETVQRKGIGFWDFSPAKGISTPSAKLMEELLAAQRSGSDLPADPTSQNAAQLPQPLYAQGTFPGHAAWIATGSIAEDSIAKDSENRDWKLHRIQRAANRVQWELYDLTNDPGESKNLADQYPEHVERLRQDANEWLEGVVNSLNGQDYSATENH